VAPLDPVTVWRPTKKWNANRGGTSSTQYGAGPVECTSTGRLGFAKPVHVWQEWLASRLGSVVGVGVPQVLLGSVQGASHLSAVSVVWGTGIDVRGLRVLYADFDTNPSICQGLVAASGLLAFHTWIGTGDHKDEHLLGRELAGGRFEFVAIDFGFAFRWGTPAEPVVGDGPKSLKDHFDTAVVSAVVNVIEAFRDEDIRDTVALLPGDVLPIGERVRVADGLVTRKTGVRLAMQAKGWI